MINEAAYREWQAWIRDLSPRKPVLIDTIWSLDRPIQRGRARRGPQGRRPTRLAAALPALSTKGCSRAPASPSRTAPGPRASAAAASSRYNQSPPDTLAGEEELTMMKRRFAAAVLVVAALPFTAHAQQKEIKIGVIYDYTGAFAAGGSEAAADRHQDRDRHAERTRRRGGLQDQRHLSPMRSRRPRWRSTRRRGSSTRRTSTSSWASIRARIACRWRSAWTRRRSSCGRTCASPPACSRTRSFPTSSGRRCTPTSSARLPAASSPRTPRTS